MVRPQPVRRFAPWIIYWVVASGPSTWKFGALCAVLSAVILGIVMGRGGPRLLDVVAIVFFFVVMTLFVDLGVVCSGMLTSVPEVGCTVGREC